MFTKTETIGNNDYTLTSFVRWNGQRGFGQIYFTAVDNDFTFNKTVNVKDINDKGSIYADFKEALRDARREYDKLVAFIINKGFAEIPPQEE
jgi:hypothetical protein